MRNGITGTGSHRRLTLVTETGTGSDRLRSPRSLEESSDIDIREVRSSADRDAILKFRHRVAVMDMNRLHLRLDYPRHAPDDNQHVDGVQLIALCHSEIVGSIQITYAFTRDLGLEADFFRMREFAGSDHPAHTCIVSHLLVDPARRAGTLGRALCVAAYRHALGENARTAFLRCNDALVYYFSSLGFKPYMGKARHAEYGDVLPMKIDLQDENYLAMIHSPFVAALRDWKRARTPEVRVVPRK